MGLNINDMQNQKNRISSTNWRPDEGANEVRILPPTSLYFEEEISFFAHEFNLHFFKQEGFNTEVSRCPRDASEYCPACEVSGRFKDSADPALQQMAKDANRTQRFLMNILDLEKPDEGIQAYTCGWTVWNGILSYLANPKWGDILDPSDGHSVIINLTPGNKSRTGWNTYDVQPDPDRTDVTELLPEDWVEQLDALEDQIPAYKETDELVQILQRMGFPVEATEAPVGAAEQKKVVAPKKAARKVKTISSSDDSEDVG